MKAFSTDLEFGQYIQKLRKARKLTIRQLELYSGVSNSYLSLLENGKRGIPTPDVLKKLHGPLNIPYEELMVAAGYIEEKRKNAEDFIDDIDLELTDEEILQKYNLTVDGEMLSLEEAKDFINYVRVKRSLKK